MEQGLITRETIKALSSDTRIGILKSLRERRKTVTELSQEMGLSKSTVHEHIGMLLEQQLIDKNENYTNKWVYYELTRKGQDLFAQNGKQFVLLLSSVLLGVLGVFSLLFSAMQSQASALGGQARNAASPAAQPAVEKAAEGAYDAVASSEAMGETAQAAVEQMQTVQQHFDPALYFGVVLVVLALVLFLLWLRKKSD